MGWSCTDTEIEAIGRVPKSAWRPAIDQDGQVLEDTFVADITALLEVSGWTPGTRVIARDEPLHPATANAPPTGRRHSAGATS